MAYDSLDRADRKILAILQTNCRISIAEIAEEIGLSPSACHRRIKLLEEAGIVESYVARLSPQALGFSMVVFVEISLSSQSEAALSKFEAAIDAAPEILECHLMAGPADYLIRVAAKDPADYERIHRELIARLPGVARVQSNFSLRTVRAWRGYKVVEPV
ncbi:Lrp/AsnC family transcriptional regulator [Rhodobium gokarnense]|uniref:DNA-binding Lrp family transcriptional regulator n=1 Tax=Rhodobium gokarnense TaxID=364296 RepID=A0ABT3HIK4_9HYPH|nr:Lrp/AsnC family transcriptional regulator [Rhodobium gokarnense]MCW2310129.1 DNA-binding Lrp family transcriptional regulator [Rhodobium gokarnense]